MEKEKKSKKRLRNLCWIVGGVFAVFQPFHIHDVNKYVKSNNTIAKYGPLLPHTNEYSLNKKEFIKKELNSAIATLTIVENELEFKIFYHKLGVGKFYESIINKIHKEK